MDENIEEIWSEENVELDEEDRTYSILQTTLGNNGAIYILGRKFRPCDRKAGVKRGPDEYEIVAITDEGQETTPLKLDNKLIDNISLFASENGEIFVGGYYRVEDGVGIDGIFLYTLNKKTGEIENEISDAFSKEFITEGWSERRVNKAKKKEDKGTDLGLRNLEFRRIVSHDDGSTSMVGEVFYITTHTYTNGSGGTTTTTTYHYTDLIISRISKEGEVMNHARYPKHHTYYGAYIYFNLNNELAIILNKSRIPLLDGDEKEMSKIEKKKNGGDALTLIQISENGETRSSGIIDYKNPEYIRFERYKRIAPDSFVIEENGKTEVLLKTYYGKGRFGIGRIIFE